MAIPVLPESAPFTTQQRAWLNGLLAGLLNLDGGISGAANGNASNGVAMNGLAAAGTLVAPALNGNGSASNGQAANGHAAPAPVAPAVEEDEEYPWHDSTIPMDERLKLSDGKRIELRLMSAMAQLDCGQCGYLCRTYAQAIATGDEKSLTKCVPGGKETSKKLKELVAAATTANEMPLKNYEARGEG